MPDSDSVVLPGDGSIRGICARWAVSAALGLAVGACAPNEAPPSIILFVLDTTRADAVSAYGEVRDTTPTFDRLAASGLLFTHAYAQAPWTLPSHATLFTGLLPSEHRVGWHRTRAPDRLTTLAERLQQRGYDTFGVSENVWITDSFNLNQGFREFEFARTKRSSVDRTVARWFEGRPPARPFFLFVNVVDPHARYAVRSENRFLPNEVTPEIARSVSQRVRDYMCVEPQRSADLAILKGLYLGEIAAADAKLERTLEILERIGQLANAITIVTSDHGEHFGEAGLVSHQFSVREALLHVPLVVHGLRGVPPAVIDTPVQLADVVPSVLEWVGAAVPADLAGRPLPKRATFRPQPRSIVAEYSDPEQGPADGVSKLAWGFVLQAANLRSSCSAEWPVYGRMRALIRYPFKLIRFAEYPPELYDLAADPEEERNLVAMHPELAQELSAELDEIAGGEVPLSDDATLHPTISDEIREQLRALGYVGDEG